MERNGGHNKFMGSGSFRGRRRPQTTPDNCEACRALRGHCKKYRAECKDLRIHKQHIERLLVEPEAINRELYQRLAETRHAQEAELQEASAQISSVGERERGLKQVATALQAEIEALRAQRHKHATASQETARAQRREAQKREYECKMHKLQADNALRSIPQIEGQIAQAQSSAADLEKQCQAALRALNKAKVESRQVAARLAESRRRRMAIESNCRAQEDERAAVEKSLKELALVRVDLEKKMAQAQQVLIETREKLEAVRQSAGQSKGTGGELAAEQRGLEEQVERLKRDIGALKQASFKMGQQIEATREQRASLTSEEAALHARLKALMDEIKRMGEDDSKQQSQLVQTQERSQKFTDMQRELMEGNAKLKKVTDAQHELEVSSKALHKRQEDIRQRERTIDTLAEELRQKAKDERAAELANKQRQIKALEDAMQSLVRLCVVAPTVNIHLADQPLDAKPPPGIDVPPPQSPAPQIRQLVEKEILAEYTNIFLQEEEGGAPKEVGGKLEGWLEGLLADMQQTIQVKLKSYFKERKRAQRQQYKQLSGKTGDGDRIKSAATASTAARKWARRSSRA
eukprot:g24.t1